jgi:hypothetical protein
MRVSDEGYARLIELAEADRRPLGSYVQLLIEDILNGKAPNLRKERVSAA